jgi:hypothetical protein
MSIPMVIDGNAKNAVVGGMKMESSNTAKNIRRRNNFQAILIV